MSFTKSPGTAKLMRVPLMMATETPTTERRGQAVAGDADDGEVGGAIDAEDLAGQVDLVGLAAVDDDIDLARLRALRLQHAEDVGVGDDDARLDGEEAAPLRLLAVRHGD